MREFFFYKLASALKIGPFLESPLGYDIMCYNDAIEFAMELCGDQGSMIRENFD